MASEEQPLEASLELKADKQQPQKLPGPQPHRCNDRVEDLIQALFSLEFSGKIRPAWRNMRECFKSEKGQEPKMPYLVITDGQQYLERRERKNPPKNFMK